MQKAILSCKTSMSQGRKSWVLWGMCVKGLLALRPHNREPPLELGMRKKAGGMEQFRLASHFVTEHGHLKHLEGFRESAVSTA